MATINNNNCSVNINIYNSIPSKQCNKCLEVKPLTEFHKRKDTKVGYHCACKACIIKGARKYYKENREQLLEQKKQYFQQNKEKIRNYKREYNFIRYHNNEMYKLKKLINRRILLALKGINKSVPTLELLGCSLEFLHNWLTSQLKEGQKLEDFDIDHLVPCSSFDLIKEEEQKRCFCWENLQILSSKDNIKKGTKRNLELELQHHLKVAKFKELMNTPLL